MRLHHQEGRFRSFILTFLKRFLADERNKENAMKRGGGVQVLSWEERIGAQPAQKIVSWIEVTANMRAVRNMPDTLITETPGNTKLGGSSAKSAVDECGIRPCAKPGPKGA
jgi:hypothetical protein